MKDKAIEPLKDILTTIQALDDYDESEEGKALNSALDKLDKKIAASKKTNGKKEADKENLIVS
jgi:transcription initiation factor IIE alpha subunit